MRQQEQCVQCFQKILGSLFLTLAGGKKYHSGSGLFRQNWVSKHCKDKPAQGKIN